jgi:hypothetical protein
MHTITFPYPIVIPRPTPAAIHTRGAYAWPGTAPKMRQPGFRDSAAALAGRRAKLVNIPLGVFCP